MALRSEALRGVSRPGSQLGQSGQPRPEPVRRTAPPVTITTASSTATTNVIRRNAAARERGSRIGEELMATR